MADEFAEVYERLADHTGRCSTCTARVKIRSKA